MNGQVDLRPGKTCKPYPKYLSVLTFVCQREKASTRSTHRSPASLYLFAAVLLMAALMHPTHFAGGCESTSGRPPFGEPSPLNVHTSRSTSPDTKTTAAGSVLLGPGTPDCLVRPRHTAGAEPSSPTYSTSAHSALKADPAAISNALNQLSLAAAADRAGCADTTPASQESLESKQQCDTAVPVIDAPTTSERTSPRVDTRLIINSTADRSVGDLTEPILIENPNRFCVFPIQ